MFGFKGRLGPRLSLLLINSFIVVNLVGLFVWVVIPPSGLRDSLLPLVLPYMTAAGLCQDFWVFAPDVNTSSADLVADVRLHDGTIVRWDYPNNSKIDFWQKPFKERYREFATALLMPQNKFLLAPMASYVMRQVGNANPDNPPEAVSLKVIWWSTPDPCGVAEQQSGTAEIYRMKAEPHEN